jgi:hypothetical protein
MEDVGVHTGPMPGAKMGSSDYGCIVIMPPLMRDVTVEKPLGRR